MSKGNPQIGTRITPEFMAWVEKQVESLNYHQSRRNDEPWDVARFIRAAIIEKLKKMKRSREWSKKNRRGVSTPAEGARHEETAKCTDAPHVVQEQSDTSADTSPEFWG
jgi:hypothetical protein